MNRDDLDNFKDYELRIRILRAAKEKAADVDTVVEIAHKIDSLEEELSDLALRMFEEGQI